MNVKKTCCLESGFSLIEIMVVIVITGLMISIAGPMVIDHLRDAEQSKIKQDFASIKVALQTYEIDNYSYPSTEQGLDALVNKTDIDPLPRRWRERGYLERMPLDPWNVPYVYVREGIDFDVYTLGRDGQMGGQGPDQDIHFQE